MTSRLRLAIPNKGRLVEPTLRLLHDAGLVFDEHDRSLVAMVQNYDLEILFVRTNDIIEFVGDGVADLGVTGDDLISETGAELPRVRPLGYGRCRLVAAVPNDTPYRAMADLAGLRIATAHPNTARRYFEQQGIQVEIVPISGAVEVAPRLGLADAIVDLVSTGSTLVMNGLRQVGDVMASEAVLVANPTAHRERAAELAAIDTMLSAVIAARGRKYLMMNAPAATLTGDRAAPAGARIADGDPARAHRHDRHPLGRRRRRRLGPAAPPQGRRRVRNPRPADREDRPVSPTSPANATGPATTAGPRTRPAGDDRPARQRPPAPRTRTPPSRLSASVASTSRRSPPAIRKPAWTTPRWSGAGPCPIPRSARPPGRRLRPFAPVVTSRFESPTARSVAGGSTAGWSWTRPNSRTRAMRLTPRIRRALDQAIANVRRFAETQRPISTTTTIAPGIEIERRWSPLASVGAYVPGGSAPYPSSLIMTVVPAQVAGVGTVVVASPADRDGDTNAVLLGAAGLLEVDAFIVAGGAQAIGALAYGLPEFGIGPVDRIVGPGNAWVTAAKVELVGEVGIDLPAGPSEGMVLAAPPADPARVAADLITQAEHGPDSPAILVTTDPAFADAVEAAVNEALGAAARREILAAALRDHGRIALAPSLDAAIAFINDYGPEHLSVDVEPLEPTVEALRNAGSIFVGPWAPESAGDYATGANHVLPTGGLARASGALAVEAYGKFTQVQRVTREGLAGIRESVGALAEAEGLLAHRDAVEIRFRERRPMSPTPVTFSSPTAPASYSWEATNEEVAARYGVDPRTIVRFDLNTSPTPPALVERLLVAGEFDAPISEYPPSDYRRLIAAAAARYGVGTDELLVGAGADEILDLIAKAFIAPGSQAIVPVPSYAMYRVCTEQRGATVVGVPRRSASDGWAIDPGGIRDAARDAAVVWLCSPNNPTALSEPDGLIEDLLAALAADADTEGRPAPIVVLDEAYAEFVGTSLVGLRAEHPNLIVVRTVSKAYALAGLRVGFAIARPELIARLNPYRPPGSVSVISVTIATEALLDGTILEANLERVAKERARLSEGLGTAGWSVGPSVTNFVLVDFSSPERAAAVAEGLLSRGLVPRTFGAGHPLAQYLRLTVRDPHENDRLIEAAQAMAEETAT